MADNIWDASTDNDANTASNWSLGNVPTAGDVMVFDSATTSANCNFSGNISCDALRFDNAYAGTIDLVTHNLDLSGDVNTTNAGLATVLLGTGTHTWSGNVDLGGIGTLGQWWAEPSTIVMDGTSKTITTSTTSVNNLTISGTVSLVIRCIASGTVEITGTGTLTNNLAGNNLNIGSGIRILSGGTVTGTGHIYTATAGTSIDVQTGGTFSLSGNNQVQRGATFVGTQTLSGSWLIENGFATQRTVTFPSGTVTFTGNVEFKSGHADGLVITNASNGSQVYQGNLTFTETAGTLTYTAGTGTITFSGTNDQTLTVPSGWQSASDRFEKFVIDKTGGSLTVAGGDIFIAGFEYDSAATSACVVDFATFAVDISGNLDCTHGGTLNNELDLGTGGAGGHTFSGDVDWQDVATFTTGTTAAWEMDGTNVTFRNHVDAVFGGSITLSGTFTTFDAPGARGITTTADVIVSGTISNSTADVRLQSGSKLTITGTLDMDDLTFSSGGTLEMGPSAVLDCDQFFGYENMTLTMISGATTATITSTAATLRKLTSGGTHTLTIGAGTWTFTGNVIFQTIKTGDYVIANNTNNPNLVVEGNVTVTETTGTLTYTAGTGTITFSGTNDQTITMPAGFTQRLEDVVIDKNGGRVKLLSDFYIESLTVTDGELDIDANTLDSSGSVSVDKSLIGAPRFWNDHGTPGPDQSNGQIAMAAAGTLTLKGSSGDLLAIENLDFDIPIGVTFDVEYCDVTDSQNTGALDIDATDGTSADNAPPANTGWDFGGAPAAVGSIIIMPF